MRSFLPSSSIGQTLPGGAHDLPGDVPVVVELHHLDAQPGRLAGRPSDAIERRTSSRFDVVRTLDLDPLDPELVRDLPRERALELVMVEHPWCARPRRHRQREEEDERRTGGSR